MTVFFRLTVPHGWAIFRLPWAVMALALLMQSGERVSIDALSRLPTKGWRKG
jgi:hypothetical protein